MESVVVFFLWKLAWMYFEAVPKKHMVDVFDGRKADFSWLLLLKTGCLDATDFPVTVETMESLQFEYQLGGLSSIIAEVIHWVCCTQVSFGESAKVSNRT